MNLIDIYHEEGPTGMRRLATAVGANPIYIYQCATGFRKPSPRLVHKLVAADKRLTREDLRPDIFLSPVDR